MEKYIVLDMIFNDLQKTSLQYFLSGSGVCVSP